MQKNSEKRFAEDGMNAKTNSKMETFFEKPVLSEPNEMGFQFGINKSLTEYAHQKQYQDANIYLPSVDITVLEVWKDDKLQAYLIIDEKTNQPIDEASGFESAAVCIDKFKLLKSSERYEKED